MLIANQAATVKHTVGPGDLASAFGPSDEAYPDVFSTPAMLGLLERACATLLRSEHDTTFMSVGVQTELSHTAPSALGADVTATAMFTHQDGKLYWFDVVAFDNAGAIGEGKHARALVTAEKILARAISRASAYPER